MVDELAEDMRFWKECYKIYLEKSVILEAARAKEFADECLDEMISKRNEIRLDNGQEEI